MQYSRKNIELIFILGSVLLAFVLFWDKGLDLWAAKKFYHPENLLNPWFEQDQPLWLFFYHAAPWLTGILLISSLLVLSISIFKESLRKIRRHAVFIFLAVALGPGLFVNSFFKPYWGRPRPREVIELGGKQQYQPFYKPRFGMPGMSFPCGHCSVGFVYSAFWLALYPYYKIIAYAILAGSFLLGGAMGVARISAGGHFFSDVVWAGLIVWMINWTLYYKVLKIQQEPTLRPRWKILSWADHRGVGIAVYSALFLLTIVALLLASPFYKDIRLNRALRTEPIEALNLVIHKGQVEILPFPKDSSGTQAFEIIGHAKGFGFPKNKLIQSCNDEGKKVNCVIQKKGFFSDFESVIHVFVRPDQVQAMNVIVYEGDINPDKLQPLPSKYHFLVRKKH